MSGEMSSKTRAYVNRPISARRNKDRLRINKISYNTEIVIIEEFVENTLDSNSFSNDSFDDKTKDKFTLYIESQIDSISDKDSEVGNKVKIHGSIHPDSEKKSEHLNNLKMFMRKRTIFKPSHQSLSDIDSDDEEELILDGDYILRSALLKDYDIQELSTKEMQH
jgi:hypothetical protein